MATPLLELRNVTKVFQSGIRKTRGEHDGRPARRFAHRPSEFPTSTAVAGESGSGKTTMARLLLGFIKPTSGQIIYQGMDVAKMDRAQARAVPARGPADLPGPVRGLQPVLQGRQRAATPLRELRPRRRTAKDASADRGSPASWSACGPRRRWGATRTSCRGGQRQRIMVARALMLRPKIIMADEPVSMVDASLRATILDELRKINTEFGISLAVHHPRPDDRLPGLRQHRHPLPGHGRRGGLGRAGHPRRRAPVHEAPRLLDPATDRPSAGASDEMQAPEASAGRVEQRLPLRAALPVRHGRVLAVDPAALPG